MYSIYHIKGVKIGASVKPKIRVRAQGYTDYEILEQHECIDMVSKRELELQKQYGYKVDTVLYKHSKNVTKKRTLTTEQELFIKKHYYRVQNQNSKRPPNTYSVKQLAKMFNVLPSTISHSINRKS